MASIKIQTAI